MQYDNIGRFAADVFAQYAAAFMHAYGHVMLSQLISLRFNQTHPHQIHFRQNLPSPRWLDLHLHGKYIK